MQRLSKLKFRVREKFGLLPMSEEAAPVMWRRSSAEPLDKAYARNWHLHVIALGHFPVVPLWQSFLRRLMDTSPTPVPTKSQHLCIQQRQEERGSHSHPTYGTMETDKERRARANWYDDDGV